MTIAEWQPVLEAIVADRFGANAEEVQRAIVDEKLAMLGDPVMGLIVAARDAQSGAAILVAAVRGSRRACVMGSVARNDSDGALLDGLEGQLDARSALTSVVTGGPPGSYLESGVDGRDGARVLWFRAHGFAIQSQHVDLRVRPQILRAGRDARVRRAGIAEAALLVAWVSETFAPAWGREVAHALSTHDAVFVAGAAGAYEGFAAHSGNNAALGSFGPLGVAPEVRGRALGAALASAALSDLAARGFEHATIPWVSAERSAFYRRLVEVIEEIPRIVLARPLRFDS